MALRAIGSGQTIGQTAVPTMSLFHPVWLRELGK
jgi:hypothetical protein